MSEPKDVCFNCLVDIEPGEPGVTTDSGVLHVECFVFHLLLVSDQLFAD